MLLRSGLGLLLLHAAARVGSQRGRFGKLARLGFACLLLRETFALLHGTRCGHFPCTLLGETRALGIGAIGGLRELLRFLTPLALRFLSHPARTRLRRACFRFRCLALGHVLGKCFGLATHFGGPRLLLGFELRPRGLLRLALLAFKAGLLEQTGLFFLAALFGCFPFGDRRPARGFRTLTLG